MQSALCSVRSLGWRIRYFSAVLAVLCVSQAVLAQVSAPGFTYVRSLSGIDEYRLDSNGLQVLLRPDHTAPVVSFNVTYHVGSRNESTGTTGATHLLEHMMFKGSEHYNADTGNTIDQYVERVGGYNNATTSFDRTNYFITLSKDALDGYVAIESDRMRNLSLRESDRQTEMTVVRNEFERGKNQPEQVLEEEVEATAYQALPYHHNTIGWRSDIENVPIEKLRDFYDTFYWPNNATVTVVGDIDPGATLALIRKHYGAIPRSPKPIPVMYTQEPEQTGARRIIVKKPGEHGSVLIAHKIPNGLSPDQPALAVLDSLLSGGKDSRLYRALVDTGLALYVSADSERRHDLSLHILGAQCAPAATAEQVEKKLLEQIEKVKAQGVTAVEVEKAKQQYRAQRAYRLDGPEPSMAELNEWIAVGDWTQFLRFPDAVNDVAPADVQRVARAYLNEDQSTTGWFVPVKGR
jgi:zinc protease